MRRCAKSSAAALVDATLLLLLRCVCGSGVGAFVRTHLYESTRSPPGHHDHSRIQQFAQSLPCGAGQPLAPAALSTGRDLERAQLHVLHGTRGHQTDDGLSRSGVRGHAQSHDYPRSAQAVFSEDPASSAVFKGAVSGVEGEMGGFGWLREFGNGKMDIAGLVLSTVLLMTAAAPLG